LSLVESEGMIGRIQTTPWLTHLGFWLNQPTTPPISAPKIASVMASFSRPRSRR